MKELILTKKRPSDWMAYTKGDDKTCEYGSTEAEAIGKLYIRLNRNKFESDILGPSEDEFEFSGIESLKRRQREDECLYINAKELMIGTNLKRLGWVDIMEAEDNVIILHESVSANDKYEELVLGFIITQDEFIQLLTEEADRRVAVLRGLSIKEALHAPTGNGNCSPLCRIFFGRNPGGYLYPRDTNCPCYDTRKALYGEYFRLAEIMFRDMCENEFFGERKPAQEQLDKLYSKVKSWGCGHSGGYSEVWDHYQKFGMLLK